MTDDRYIRIKALFLKALELDAAARVTWLEQLGATAPEDRVEVESLLAHADTGEEAVAALGSSSTQSAPRLRNGEVFAERYRIDSLLGEGGIGEVYRAQDLVIGGSIALKLLRLETSDRSEMILNEVRLARQITHPGVCRVHDVGRFGDEYFITMEYIEGEDLAARVRRTGGLPPDEVLSIARQLCGGLAAAHARGILHRDLKPANVLIDREGQVKITDFGLAVSDSNKSSGSGGTPSYMAPEQFVSGGQITEQTDIYALGLLLHELLTGRPVFTSNDFLTALKERTRRHPEAAAILIAGVDPALDRVIRAATQPDPRRRPASALAIAAALPGGDPLGIAIATGSTASPEIVAAADAGREVLSWRAGLSWLVALVALLTIMLALGSPEWNRGAPHLTRSPAMLAAGLDATLRSLGIDSTGAPIDQGFSDDPTVDRLPRAILYWQRITLGAKGLDFWERLSRASFEDIPSTEPQTTVVVAATDLAGRLVYLRSERPIAASSSGETVDTPRRGVEWNLAMKAAGIDLGTVKRVEAPLPELFADSRFVWTAVDPDRADSTVLIQAAAAGSQPVLFQVQRGTPTTAQQIPPRSSSVALRVRIAATFLIVTPLIALVLAAVNLRRGSADRRGARRVAWAVVLSSFVALLLAPGHAYGPADESSGLERLFAVLISAAMAWFVYIGLEPWARRFRPRLLIAWTRVLGGRFRDALVGRSLLTGAVVGTLFVVIDQVDRWVCGALGTAPLVPAIAAEHLAPAFGGLQIAAAVISRFPSSLSLVLPFVLSLVIVRRWLPVRWSGPTAYLLYTIVFWGLLANDPKVSLFVSAPLTALVALLTLERVGLLSIVTAATIAYLLVGFPLSLTLGAWYSTGTLVALALTLVVAVAGLWLACAPPRSAALGRHSSQENF